MIVDFYKHKDKKEKDLEEFAKKQWPKTRAYLQNRYSLTEDDCAEVFQESLIILWENIKENKVETYNLKESSSTYFMTICRNKTMELLRSNSKFIELTPKSDIDDETNQFLPDKVEMILALDEDKGEIQEEKEELVRAILKDLPSPCNELLWGYYGDGKSTKDLAQDYYNGSEGTVKVTKHRCVNKFRQRFNVEYQKLLRKYDEK